MLNDHSICYHLYDIVYDEVLTVGPETPIGASHNC